MLTTIYKITLVLAALHLIGCDQPDSSEKDQEETERNLHWRYFDRELFLPTGISVSPEMAAAQDIIQNSLHELERSTDLGVDYFIYFYEENSLLQPVTEETQYQGRNWRSFIQVWDDDEFNDFLANEIGTTGDQDALVMQNSLNEREYYMILRLSCFVAEESCGHPSQNQTKAMIWRSFGYLIGLRHGENAASAIMEPGFFSAQEEEGEKKKFLAEFDGQLERMRNELPTPVVP